MFVIVSRFDFFRFGVKRTDSCVSAWNKDPVFGVIGIQSGPRG